MFLPPDFPTVPRALVKAELSLVAARTWGVLAGTAGAAACSRGLRLGKPGRSFVLGHPVGCPAASAHLVMATGRLRCLVCSW